LLRWQTHSNQTVTFDAGTGLIVAVRPSVAGEDFSAYSSVIDGSGHTLLPGLIEAHMHCTDAHLPPGTDNRAILTAPLRSGVTTVCDMHTEPEQVTTLQIGEKAEVSEARNLLRQGKAATISQSNMKSCHLAATIAGGWPKPIVLANHPTEEVSLTSI
jgi:dihydroorotase-like cyclic amidohydrolase